MLKVVSIGKTKEQYIQEGIKEFLKRIQKFTKIEYLELKNKEQVLNQLKGTVVTLEVQGKSYSSEELAQFIKKEEIKDTITFIIGDEAGVPKEIKADYTISLSAMTFTHEMARLFLLEQLYRAYTINSGRKYHK